MAASISVEEFWHIWAVMADPQYGANHKETVCLVLGAKGAEEMVPEAVTGETERWLEANKDGVL